MEPPTVDPSTAPPLAVSSKTSTKSSGIGSPQERRARRKQILALKRGISAAAAAAAKPSTILDNNKKLPPPPSKTPQQGKTMDSRGRKETNLDSQPPAAAAAAAPIASGATTTTTHATTQPPPPPPSTNTLHPALLKPPPPARRSQQSKHSSHKKQLRPIQRMVLSTLQKQQVDVVFESLFGYAWGQTPTLLSKESTDERVRKLQQVFCPSTVAQILHNLPPPSVRNTNENKPRDYRIQMVSKSNTQQLRPLSKPITTTTTTKTTTTKTPPSSSAAPVAASMAATTAPATGGGVDALLQQMQGTKGTSTILKTAMDWESFKQDSNLGEKLEEHAESKGAYLKRQDFLNRVDHRTFEQERQERERTRSRNASSGKKN